ncbi:helix-turn-helix transcriptional regulator [Paraburkholderia diazotrophica]|uniref:HTH-type transcriptional regulator / antitoxin HipB n=1 Tax=Paraburkholderia diazotrophica TaxID=667676 RepID=A0A1H6WZQ3_9BURK|nr:helix-turn-helix transcriptional regulator [Paraburkholderia diazotrophica]SEJ17765.1 HTH-type transcriptional regulator / antitoxin HipB [Paraburkholderia diazotrophica]
MDYSVKTLGQLRPVLRGFRKAAGLTQAMLAERLGVTQQSYAQFEANPAAAGVERLFKVLRLLNAGITLSQDAPSPANTAPVAKMAPSNRAAATNGNVSTVRPAAPRKAEPKRAAPARKTGKRAQPGKAAPGARMAASKSTSGRKAPAAVKAKQAATPPKKRENW